MYGELPESGCLYSRQEDCLYRTGFKRLANEKKLTL
jgi:hypothetical protein